MSKNYIVYMSLLLSSAIIPIVGHAEKSYHDCIVAVGARSNIRLSIKDLTYFVTGKKDSVGPKQEGFAVSSADGKMLFCPVQEKMRREIVGRARNRGNRPIIEFMYNDQPLNAIVPAASADGRLTFGGTVSPGKKKGFIPYRLDCSPWKGPEVEDFVKSKVQSLLTYRYFDMPLATRRQIVKELKMELADSKKRQQSAPMKDAKYQEEHLQELKTNLNAEIALMEEQEKAEEAARQEELKALRKALSVLQSSPEFELKGTKASELTAELIKEINASIERLVSAPRPSNSSGQYDRLVEIVEKAKKKAATPRGAHQAAAEADIRRVETMLENMSARLKQSTPPLTQEQAARQIAALKVCAQVPALTEYANMKLAPLLAPSMAGEGKEEVKAGQ